MSLHRPNSGWLLWVVGAIFLLLMGCSDKLPTYPVSGKVQFPDGSPVRVGTVELKSREQGVQARGTIATDGTFTLTTYEEDDGAVEGTHDAVVVQMIVTEDLAGHPPTTLGVVDRRFGSYATSGLSAVVKRDQENRVVLQVEGLQDRPSRSDGHKHGHTVESSSQEE